MFCHTQGIPDLQRLQEQVSRDLHAAQLRIDNLTRWKSPDIDSIDGRVLAALENKRERLSAELLDIQSKLPAPASRLDVAPAGEIRFKKWEWQPAGSIKIIDVIGDIPASLVRGKA